MEALCESAQEKRTCAIQPRSRLDLYKACRALGNKKRKFAVGEVAMQAKPWANSSKGWAAFQKIGFY